MLKTRGADNTSQFRFFLLCWQDFRDFFFLKVVYTFVKANSRHREGTRVPS